MSEEGASESTDSGWRDASLSKDKKDAAGLNKEIHTHTAAAAAKESIQANRKATYGRK